MDEKIYDADFSVAAETLGRLADFVAVVRQLRRDCPWDRAQTHASVRHLLIEETYEAVAAIDEEDWDALKKELGDVLLHVVFHSTIAEEDGRFTLEDVVAAETEKLVRRHPHVFGEGGSAKAGSAEAVEKTWEEVKREERAAESAKNGASAAPPSALDGVPGALPALLRAHRIQQKAAGVGFDFPDRAGAWSKVEEELSELRALTESDASSKAKEAEFGDVLFALVNYARRAGLNAENALRATNDTFTRRFRHVERRLAGTGRAAAEASLDEMDALWNEAKERERASGRGGDEELRRRRIEETKR